MSTLEYKIFYRRHLPHIQPPGATLFITFRLAGSIPAEVQKQLIAEAERVEAALIRISGPKERARQAYQEQRRLFGKWDTILDTGESGPFWLREREVAALMVEALHYRDDRVYDLDAFVVRDEAERQRIITYVLNNPVKANLVEHWQDWPWTYSKHPL